MAFASVQSLGSNSSSSATSLAITTAVTHTAGNKIVVWVAWGVNTRTLTSVSDSAGNTYTVLHSRLLSGKCCAVAISNGTNALASGGTITATLSGASITGLMLCAREFSGGSVTEDTGAETDNNGASSTDATATFNPSQANELAVASIASVSTAAGDYATPSGWTNSHDFKCTGQSLCLRADYAINLATGSRTDTWVGTLKNSWTVSLSSLLVAAPGSGSDNLLPLMNVGA